MFINMRAHGWKRGKYRVENGAGGQKKKGGKQKGDAWAAVSVVEGNMGK